MCKIHRLKLRLSNAYLLQGDRPVLVDTGSPNEIETIRRLLGEHGVALSDLALIIHTHVHSDHVGSTAAIAEHSNCPISFHSADQDIADRSNNGHLVGPGLRAKMMSRIFSNVPFPPVRADLDAGEGMSLREFGVEATVMHTPGHTAGSISIMTPNGEAVVGDVLMGGYLGGQIMPRRPNRHYFAYDFSKAMSSLGRILSQAKGTLHVGHGGPLTHDSVARWHKRFA